MQDYFWRDGFDSKMMESNGEFHLIDIAADIFWLVPLPSFTIVDAMVLAGIPKDVALTSTFKNKIKVVLTSLEQQRSKPNFENNAEGKVEGTINLLKILPEGNKEKIADMMRLVGCDSDDTKAGALRQKLQRRITKWKKESQQQEECQQQSRQVQYYVPPPILNVEASRTSTGSSASSLSRASTGSAVSNSSPLLSSSGSLSIDDGDLSLPPSLMASSFSSTSSSYSRIAQSSSMTSLAHSGLAQFQSRARINNNSIASHTQILHTRLNSKEKQSQQQLGKNEDNIKASMFKQGTLLWKSVEKGTNKLKKFETAELCAELINEMYGIEGLSGRELQKAVKEGRVGVSPPPRGRPSKISDEDFKAFAQLFFTLSAIEQSNAEPQRLTRPKLISLAGIIVNEKLMADGASSEMSDISFYERIQKENSDKQGVVVTDPRDALRVKWLTYRNQLSNHENWEDECVRLGFARRPSDDRERDEKGHIVFFEGQEKRFCNLDEMPFALDGAEATAGGRPAVTPSIDMVAEAGQTSDKSSQKCTLVFGIIGDEPMPPLFIFPSSAKTMERMKIDTKKLLSFQQVHGQYGFDSKMYHDTTVAMSGKGGMNAVIFENWIAEHVMPLWPDLEDVPGKRVMLKTDMGPGRFQDGFLSRTFVEGMGVFPGLPNGTGCGQEMDQLFCAFKTCCYRNRTKLYNARHALDESATITLLDAGYIIFGGSVLLKDGRYIEMEQAFALYFSPAHIKAARVKCGYCPATRNALNSSQIRHEVVAGEENDIEENSDPHGALLDQLEKENHAIISQLEERG